MPITVPDNTGRLKLSAIRAQMALLLTSATALFPARIHKEWKLKLDFGKVTSLLKPSGSTQIHSWMIGTSSLIPEMTALGDYAFVGGRRVDREINFSVWGFFDTMLKNPDLSLSSQEIAEEEAELIADYFKVNPKLGFDIPAPGLKAVKPFIIENIDSHSFSDGSDVTVAQCSIKVVLAR